jgi:hypothetical protein
MRTAHTFCGRPHRIVHPQDGALELLAAVKDDRPLRVWVADEGNKRRAIRSTHLLERANVPEAVFRCKLLTTLHVEGTALHLHIGVRFDNRLPTLILAPLAYLGECATVRVRRIVGVTLRRCARVVEKENQGLHITLNRGAWPRVEVGRAGDIIDQLSPKRQALSICHRRQ